MAIEGLTPQQSDFIERFLKVPKVFSRKAMKQKRREAAEQFRLFNAELEQISDDIAQLNDPEMRSILRGQLAAAEKVIERDPKNLDFEGGHDHLVQVQAAVRQVRAEDTAPAVYAALEKTIEEMRKENPLIAQSGGADGQSDIALTWTYVQEKFQSGTQGGSHDDLVAAIKAMARLEVMIRTAQKAAQNPFESLVAEMEGVGYAAREGLDPAVLDARRRLLDTHNQLSALREMLNTQFGADKVPLALRIACSTTQKKLDAAGGAAPAKLIGLADDAEAGYRDAQKSGAALIAEAKTWAQDHEAFRVRYAVMQAHAMRNDAVLVKPEFDKVTQAYTEARQKAATHDYAEASRAIAVVRHDLKDALDFADDCATYNVLFDERKALLDTLPTEEQCQLDKLKQDRLAAKKLLDDARTAQEARQMVGALAVLNQIPTAVADIIDQNKHARNFKRYQRACTAKNTEHAALSAEVKALLEDKMAYCLKALAAAEADRGAYRSAYGQLVKLYSYQVLLKKDAEYLAAYLLEKTAFGARLKAAKDRKGPDGRVAIESYYQALVADEAKRAGAEASGDFKLANAMCLRAKNDHDEMMKLADQAKAYLARKTEFDVEMAKLKGKKSADALEAKATAEKMLAHAVAATGRANWMAGENLLENAILEVKRAVSDAETAALIDGLQNGPDAIILTPTMDFKDAYAGFAKILDHVRVQDKDGLFEAQLRAADTSARAVEGLITADLAKAQETFNAATAACKDVALKLTAAASYSAQKTAMVALIGEAKATNAANVIDPEVADAEKALQEAEAAATSSAMDFAGAIALLAEGQAKARLGLDVMAIYDDPVKAARDKIGLSLGQMGHAAVADYVKPHAARLQSVLDQMNDDFDARKLSQAAAQAVKGRELCDDYALVLADCRSALRFLNRRVIGKTGIEMTHATTIKEAAEITAFLATMQAELDKGQFLTAKYTGRQAYWLMNQARKKAGDFDLYLPVKLTSEQKLDALEVRSVVAAGPAYDAVVTLRQTFDKALEKEKLDNFSGALKQLDGFAVACDQAGFELDKYDRYILHKTKAQKALEVVRKVKSPAIEPLLARLEGKDLNAQRKAEGFDFELASALYAELATECETAKDTADAVIDFAKVTSDIKGIGEGDQDDLKAAIAKAEATLTELSSAPSAMYVHQEIVQTRARLKNANDLLDDDFDASRQDLEAAVDGCVQMRLLMGQYDQLNDSSNVARELGRNLLEKHPLRAIKDHEKYACDDIEQRLAALETSMIAARKSKSNRAQTQTQIEETISALRDLRKVLDLHLKYAQDRVPVEDSLAQLEKGEHRHLIRDDLTAARKLLDTSATRAADRNHASAMQELKAAGLQLEMARLRTKLATNADTRPEDVSAILNAPGGIDNLDEIVKNLEASAQRKVMAVAFEARFGCKLELLKPGADGADTSDDALELAAVNIRKFYDEMSKLPPSDTLDNDSMLNFSQKSGKQEGSAYNSGSKTVKMREGDESSSGIYAISVEHEIGEVDPKAVPKEGEERTNFSWNTLHEVGHAVDDKLGFMKAHGERLAGWTVYGGNVGEAAKEIADHFKFDADYVAQYMLSSAGRKLPAPDPVGCDAEEWQRRMSECRMFVDRARVGNKPWSSASVAAACAIGNYTYVESYEKSWARYRTDQRKFAVSGYQFRAPGEWFSELYAALHSGRLNDNHPHRPEFEKL
jgi:hypothetical protein